MAMRSPDSDDPRPIRSLLRRLIAAPAALAIIWPLILVMGGYFAWNHWGANYLEQKYYGVDPTQIQITEPPSYVRSEVIQDVYQDTAMENLSLLQPAATAKIASAFQSHPWIRRVNSVRKLPGGAIRVHVDYRSPVAMVRVISRHPEVNGSSFFVVDGDGTLLPTSEFSRADTRNYIHIEVADVYPTGFVGSPFGEYRVEAAARLAELLTPFRKEMEIAAISAQGDDREHSIPQLEITTHDGVRFFWGSAPGAEQPREARAETKLQTLLSSGITQGLDLRLARPIGSKRMH